MIDHLPHRLTWDCASCGMPWPCRTRRVDLLTEYQEAPVALAVYLAWAFVECSTELQEVPAGELYARFLGWLRLHRVGPPT
jgi:hypothetical protein